MTNPEVSNGSPRAAEGPDLGDTRTRTRVETAVLELLAGDERAG